MTVDYEALWRKLHLNGNYGQLPGGAQMKYASSSSFTSFVYETFPVKTLVPTYDSSYQHCYGVKMPYLKSQDLEHYWKWCNQTFGPAAYEVDGAARTIWFKEDKHRTMFVLKWS